MSERGRCKLTKSLAWLGSETSEVPVRVAVGKCCKLWGILWFSAFTCLQTSAPPHLRTSALLSSGARNFSGMRIAGAVPPGFYTAHCVLVAELQSEHRAQRTMSSQLEVKTLAEYDTAVKSGKACAFFWAAWHEPSLSLIHI